MIKYRGEEVKRVMFRGKEISIPYIRDGLVSMVDFKDYDGTKKTNTVDLISGKAVQISTNKSKKCLDISSKTTDVSITSAEIVNVIKSRTTTIQQDIFVNHDMSLNSHPNTFFTFSIGGYFYVNLYTYTGKLELYSRPLSGNASQITYNIENFNIDDYYAKFITVSLVFDDTSIKLYMGDNKILEGSMPSNMFEYISSNIIYLFAGSGGWNRKCILYNSRIYNRALSLEEIRANNKVFTKRFNIRYVPTGLILDLRAEDKFTVDGDYTFWKDNSIYENHFCCLSTSAPKQSTIDKYISFNNTPMVNTNCIFPKESFTVEINLDGLEAVDSSSTHKGICGDATWSSGFVIRHFTNNTIMLHLPNSTTFENKIELASNTRNVCITISYNKDTRTLSCYRNGAIVKTVTVEYFASYNNTITIGGGWERFVGQIKSFRIYNRVLSNKEIEINYSEDKRVYIDNNIPTAGLVCDFDGRIPPTKSSSASIDYWNDASANNNKCECQTDKYSWDNGYMYNFNGGTLNGLCRLGTNEISSSSTIIIYAKRRKIGSAYDMLFGINDSGQGGYISFMYDAITVNYFMNSGSQPNNLADTRKFKDEHMYHIAISVDKTNNKRIVYVNGEEVVSALNDVNLTEKIYNLCHGYASVSGTSISAVCSHSKTSVYNRCLSQQEILQHYKFCSKTFQQYSYSGNNNLIYNIDGYDTPVSVDGGRVNIINRCGPNDAYISTLTNTNIYDLYTKSIKLYKENEPVVIPNVLSGNQKQFTISMRFKYTETKNDSVFCILSKRLSSAEGMLLYVDSANVVKFDLFNSSLRTNLFNLSIGETCSIDLAYNDGLLKIYKNGNFIKSVIYDTKVWNQDPIIIFGENRFPYRTSGEINCFRVYNRALKDNEILNNYNCDMIRFQPLSTAINYMMANTTIDVVPNVYTVESENIYLVGNNDVETIIVPDNIDLKSIDIRNCSKLKTIKRESSDTEGVNLLPYSLDYFNIQDCPLINKIKYVNINTDTIPDNFLNGVGIENTIDLFTSDCISRIKVVGKNFMNYCDNLIDVSDLFMGSSVEVVYQNMFNNCKSLSKANNLFKDSKLKSIPENVFIGTPVKYLKSAFENCIDMSGNIYNNFLLENVDIVDISLLFANCSKITGTFINFDKWRYETVTHSKLGNVKSCYKGCTSLEDFDTIPFDMRF